MKNTIETIKDLSPLLIALAIIHAVFYGMIFKNGAVLLIATFLGAMIFWIAIFRELAKKDQKRFF